MKLTVIVVHVMPSMMSTSESKPSGSVSAVRTELFKGYFTTLISIQSF